MRARSTQTVNTKVHDWAPTAVSGYFYAKCDRSWQLNIAYLDDTQCGLNGIPECLQCFPETVKADDNG